MTKPFSIALAGLLLGACYSASAIDIDAATKAQCRALPGVDDVNLIEVVDACNNWIEAEPGTGDPYYYYGRTVLDDGATERAMEMFSEGAQKGSRLSENALRFAQEGSLYGGVTTFSEETFDYFQSRAESGDPVAEILVGIHLGYQQPGNPSEDDRKRMLELFHSASDSGEPVATYLLGAIQVNDDNPDNDSSGVRMLRKAAEEGVGAAYDELARIGAIDEVPVDIDHTRYRTGAPVDVVMRQP